MPPMKMIPSKFVATITVIDPDTKLPVEVEIRKLEGGPMVGLDGAYLAQLDDASDHPNSPYDDHARIVVPDNEEEQGEPLRAKFFNVPVWGSVDPSLDGPYTTAEERDAEAKKIHAEQEEEAGLFWLDIDNNGNPIIGSFSNADFEEEGEAGTEEFV